MNAGSKLLAATALYALTSVASPRFALAQAPAAPVSVAPPLRVWIDPRGAPVEQDRLRQLLSRELGREVVLTTNASDSAVQIRLPSKDRARVDYSTPGGERVTREVELPPDSARSLEVLSWLTVNLVRDEASELLDALRARRREEADARAAADKAAADRAAADKAAADKAAADKAAADKAAADKAAAEAARRKIALQVEPAPNAGLLRDPLKSYDLALITPLSLLRDSRKRELHLQLALVYGESGGIRGAAISPLSLRIRRDLIGHAVAAGAVFVGGSVDGTVIAAGYSQIDNNLRGVQVGAGMALHRGKLARGAVLSAGIAVAGEMSGVILGVGAASARRLDGVGVSAGVVFVRGPAEGVLAGAGATFAEDFKGVQVAAGVNVARDLNGLTVAPVNVQRQVRGIQIGIINVAQDVEGASIGVISISRNGRVQPVLWGDQRRAAHVALKSIAGSAFTQLGGGIAVESRELSYEGGAGLHLRLGEKVFLEPGVHYGGRQTADATQTGAGLSAHDLHLLLGIGLRLGNKLDLLVAGGVRQTFAGDGKGNVAPSFRAGLAFF